MIWWSLGNSESQSFPILIFSVTSDGLGWEWSVCVFSSGSLRLVKRVLVCRLIVDSTYLFRDAKIQSRRSSKYSTTTFFRTLGGSSSTCRPERGWGLDPSYGSVRLVGRLPRPSTASHVDPEWRRRASKTKEKRRCRREKTRRATATRRSKAVARR